MHVKEPAMFERGGGYLTCDRAHIVLERRKDVLVYDRLDLPQRVNQREPLDRGAPISEDYVALGLALDVYFAIRVKQGHTRERYVWAEIRACRVGELNPDASLDSHPNVLEARDNDQQGAVLVDVVKF